MSRRSGLGLPIWERTWPQRRERAPRFTDPYYLHYSALSSSLVQARERYLRGQLDVLDVGCGEMPYYPLFAAGARDYAGSDVEARPRIRHVCPVERLEMDDASFDLVLCTQVLEHARDPVSALREMARVLRPGGHLFLTTHGVWPFHPYPDDRWRWTQQGLETLVRGTDGLELLEVVPHRATASCIALMVNYYVDIAGRRRPLRPLALLASAALNCAGLIGDRIPRFGYPHPDTLIHNFLVIARRTGESSPP